MEGKVLEQWFDIPLFSQMYEMIYQLSQKKEKYNIRKENERYALFPFECKESLEDIYDFRYPGEVLERLSEKTQVTKKQLRSLGLALGMTCSLQEENMFVGTQKTSFFKCLRECSKEDDPYILGIRYLLEENRKAELYSRILSYPFKEIEEILFVLWILPEDKNVWEQVKNTLNDCLGINRKISVFENAEVYLWITEHLQEKMNGYRKKDMDSLKYLIRLPFVNAAGSNRLQEKLADNGYSIEEIRFLNMEMIWKTRLQEKIQRDSITAEKIALDVCRIFLGSKKKYPTPVYQLCDDLCSYYTNFSIKINGWENIFEALGQDLEVCNITSYKLLYGYKNKRHAEEKWKYIDLTDPVWIPLYEWMDRKEFEECVALTLAEKEYGKEELECYLKNYQKITGKEYLQHFWEKEDYMLHNVFERLSEWMVLDPVSLIQQLLEEYRSDKEKTVEKWHMMTFYLKKYMNSIKNAAAFEMLKLLIHEFGVSEECFLFPLAKIVRNSLCLDSYDIRHKRLNLYRPFLGVEEHRMLFLWAEELVFFENPELYPKFLYEVLNDKDTLLWMPLDDARKIASELWQNEQFANYEQNQLRKLYLTKEEYEAYKNQISIQERRLELKREMINLQKLKKAFTVLVAKTKGKKEHIKELQHFVRFCSYANCKKACEIVVSYLKSESTAIRIYSEKEIGTVLELLGTICRAGTADLETVRKVIDHVEVTENEE